MDRSPKPRTVSAISSAMTARTFSESKWMVSRQSVRSMSPNTWAPSIISVGSRGCGCSFAAMASRLFFTLSLQCLLTSQLKCDSNFPSPRHRNPQARATTREMLAFAHHHAFPTSTNTLFSPDNFETMTWLCQALPFLTFVLGVAVGGALMYIPMALRLWKLRRRLAKSEFHEPEQGSPQARGAIAVRK
jgi:hypothetical protein